MMRVKIDETSFIFKPNNTYLEDVELSEWYRHARHFINLIEDKLSLPDIFGERMNFEKGMNGYDVVYTYNGNVSSLFIGYSTKKADMGIYLHFSATGFAQYLDAKGIEVYELYKLWDSLKIDAKGQEIASAYASRLDVAIDLIDYGFSIPKFYEGLAKQTIIIKSKTGRKNLSSLNAVLNDGEIETIYIGKRNLSPHALLRIYNKKNEQISNKGSYMLEAVQCSDWTRFEMVLRKDYSKQAFAEIALCESREELSGLLFSLMLDRYQFFKSDEKTKLQLTNDFFEMSDGNIDLLDASRPTDRSILASAMHLVNGAGLLSTMYKIEHSTDAGRDQVNEFMKFIMEQYENYEPNEDVIKWLDQNAEISPKSEPWEMKFEK